MMAAQEILAVAFLKASRAHKYNWGESILSPGLQGGLGLSHHSVSAHTCHLLRQVLLHTWPLSHLKLFSCLLSL